MASAMEQARSNGYYDQLKRDYTHRRDLLANSLAQAGLETLPIGGSYFLMADIAGRGFESDVAFCEWLVETAGVVALPPSAFYQDPTTAPLLARFCFAKSDATIAAAAERRLQRPCLHPYSRSGGCASCGHSSTGSNPTER